MNTTPVKPAIGSLYLDDAGDAYRLRGYGSDWENPDNPDPETIPDYAVLRIHGGMGAVHELPASSVLIRMPKAEVQTHGARPPRTGEAGAR